MYREKPYKRLEIVFAEGLRAVTHQQGVLDSVRTRATTLTAWDSSSATGRPATDDAPAAALLAVDTRPPSGHPESGPKEHARTSARAALRRRPTRGEVGCSLCRMRRVDHLPTYAAVR